MSKLKMNCGYCGRKCSLEKDFCIPQDSIYVCKSCYEWQSKLTDLEAKLAEKDKIIETQHNGIGYWKSVAEKRPDIDYIFKIKDLEQQLAEKEKQCKECKHLNKKIELNIKNKLMAENSELQKQLADTEAQNKRVLEKLDLIVRSNQELEKENELMAKTLKMTKFIEKEVNQDKISFCIEQLEKVKEFVKETSGIVGHEWRIDRFRVLENIDQQIKELKEKGNDRK